MPRISEIEDEGDDPTLSSIFTYQRENYGGVLNPTKVLAHRPGILKAAIGLYAACEESGLVPVALLSLVYARVDAINGCPFLVDINSLRAGEADGGLDKVAALEVREKVTFSMRWSAWRSSMPSA